MSDRHIFITGCSGLIGRALARTLTDHGYRVSGYGLGEQYYRHDAFFKALAAKGTFSFTVGSILDQLEMTAAMRGCDAVVHLAAMMGYRRTEENRLRCLDINVSGTERVLAAAVANGISHVVLMSSAAVYGEPASNPVPESAETKPTNVYGVSKLAAEELAKGYAQLFPSLAYTIVRLFNTYGDDAAGQIALNAFVGRVLAGEDPIVHGDGAQRRCYTHVDDVCNAVVTMLENPVARNRTYNIGNPKQVFAHRELAQMVIDVLAPHQGLAIKFLPKKPSGGGREIHTSYGDTTFATAELGFHPRISLEEGLRRIKTGLNN